MKPPDPVKLDMNEFQHKNLLAAQLENDADTPAYKYKCFHGLS